MVRRQHDGELTEDQAIDICIEKLGLTREWLLHGWEYAADDD